MKIEEILKRELIARRLSRRDFVRSLASIGLTAGPAMMLADQVISTASAQTPKKGGTLRIATADASAADSLDPIRAESRTTMIHSAILFEKLTEFDFDGKLMPSLAVSWSPNSDATVWTFELQKDVVFHNGKKMMPADVIYSYQRIIKDGKSGGSPSLNDVAQMRADGPDKVVIELKSANVEFDYYLATRHLVIMPEGASDFPKDAIGTGPWKLKEYNPGMTTTFVRHDGYRKGPAYIDAIESTGIGDEGARLNALLSGEMDMIESLNPNAVARLNASGVASAQIRAGIAHVTFPMNCKTAPFDNNDVRRALKHSFDRKRLLNLGYGGVGDIGRDAVVWPSDPMFCDDIDIPQVDGDLVKSLLRKAGQSNTVFELFASDPIYGGANASVVLAELMKENGVSVKVTKVPGDEYFSTTWMKKPFFAGMWAGRPTAIGMLEAAYTTRAGTNESAYSNPKLDQMVSSAKRELDASKRKSIMFDIQHLLADDGGSIIPLYVPWIDGVASRVQNFKTHPRQPIGCCLWHDVWLAA